MTDKQIIIDRVDVSEWTDEEIYYKFEKHSSKAIRQIAFDLYKQLKRKGQECEELKKECNEYFELMAIRTEVLAKIANKLGMNTGIIENNELFCKIDQLKAENEDLKKQVNDLLNKPEIQDKILWKIDNEAVLGSKDAWIYKLEQTLTEIKEIAKIEYPKSLFTETFVEVINHCPYFDCGKCKCLENKETQNCGGFICSRKQSVYYQENTIYFKQILQKISEVEDD